ncbi:PEP-CTERM protein sorting domain protein [Anaerohalosphaera lusitana]|uniref:PEP-CTERM protein sorting domain protein n=1 Tax=Anaerohalosphaera lusitana TaxID=1936003 RepID=A0A1U9NLH7_9BACT|nr:PEP-CTERM sorting domain-containing protein [Anaerohalosphaera lusitana]AQT68657.1 PEP-CTERM protein sorting domain protein [Anaerohalosphaera lusitana]
MDFSTTNFSVVSDLSPLRNVKSLERLSFANCVDLDGDEVAELVANLDSLNWLDVTGPWDSWNADVQADLLAWDAAEGNELVVPEPATFALLGLGAIATLRRRKRQ